MRDGVSWSGNLANSLFFMEWIWIFSLCMYVESCNNTYVSVKNDVTEVRKENFIRGKLIWIGLHLYVHIFGEG